MPYSKKTKLYRIPVMGKGDVLNEKDEMSQMTIVDNLLYAATYGCSKCVIEEGKYALKKSDGGYRLSIQPIEEFSLLGILNYRLFYQRNELLSQEIPVGVFYYMYAEYTEGLEADAESFIITGYPYRQIDDDHHLLICTINTAAGTINLDVNKVFAKNILAHTADKTNPHGKTLNQEILLVNNALTVQNHPIYGAIYANVESNGGSGVRYLVSADYKIVFVHAYPENTSAGMIAWKAIGNEVVLTNLGASGVKINLKIEVEKR